MKEIILEGDCPKCNVRLSLDESDRDEEWIDCPNCNLHFKMDKIKNSLTSKELDKINQVVRFVCIECEALNYDEDGFGQFVECFNCGNTIDLNNVKIKESRGEFDNQRVQKQNQEIETAIRMQKKDSKIKWGIGMIVVGLILTFFSYSITPGGGSYFVFTGLVFFGIINLIGGLLN